ncbi:Peroxisomal membrane protein PMP27 [Cyphellophora attinorum]|uniref:Peroxisomal membrane protein PMP27 n=1 Tax=Cyphellophora attinorum TaxID=1664694 RepID=A0A0N1H366_9EURO|nr:Peroxisomal membrane protein PMP27 [Phialophora attinorum]KPI39213.1 Peroxisomal membrane protein PMP27 [Phialophora attinorum]
MVADALVYHPAVSHYLRYVATTIGRDKVLRTIQYFSRFYAWYLYRTNNPERLIQPWATLKVQFALVRKVLRAGKFVEHVRAGSELYDAASKTRSGDQITAYLQILRQVGYAGYLFFDMLTLPDALGVKKYTSAKRLQATAYRMWLLGLAASASAGVYTHYKLQARLKGISVKDPEGRVERLNVAKQQKATNMQLVSDLCDLTVPVHSLDTLPSTMA